MAKATEAQLSRRELAAWRGLLRTHARVMAELDAELEAAHALAVPEYEVLLVLTQTGDNHLRMSELADAALLTRSGNNIRKAAAAAGLTRQGHNGLLARNGLRGSSE